ncbi:uncharacterized protein LOC121965462, partial [Plectropomus leopardus]|uniref:uncharacterized protein LOC121965462 n=1 Tax=Plectropomus leopardus TaxID=160734 RepID=UPI001C4DD004
MIPVGPQWLLTPQFEPPETTDGQMLTEAETAGLWVKIEFREQKVELRGGVEAAAEGSFDFWEQRRKRRVVEGRPQAKPKMFCEKLPAWSPSSFSPRMMLKPPSEIITGRRRFTTGAAAPTSSPEQTRSPAGGYFLGDGRSVTLCRPSCCLALAVRDSSAWSLGRCLSRPLMMCWTSEFDSFTPHISVPRTSCPAPAGQPRPQLAVSSQTAAGSPK